MMENNRNQGDQSNLSQDQSNLSQDQSGSMQQDRKVNQENPQDGEQWSNYRTRELAPKEESDASSQSGQSGMGSSEGSNSENRQGM
jgi:hypothetical protein